MKIFLESSPKFRQIVGPLENATQVQTSSYATTIKYLVTKRQAHASFSRKIVHDLLNVVMIEMIGPYLLM